MSVCGVAANQLSLAKRLEEGVYFLHRCVQTGGKNKVAYSTSTVSCPLQMMESVRTATHPVSPALERRRTNVQNVQKVCNPLMCQVCSQICSSSFIFSWLHATSYPSPSQWWLFTLSASCRAVFDHAANMCVKVSGGFLCRSAEWCVWGVPSRLLAVCGCSTLHPLSEHSQSSVIPAGRTVCPTVCQVSSHSYRVLFFRVVVFVCIYWPDVWDASSEWSKLKRQKMNLLALDLLRLQLQPSQGFKQFKFKFQQGMSRPRWAGPWGSTSTEINFFGR